MTGRSPPGPQGWPEFYDPDLYEQKVGPGLRVGDAYIELLSEDGPQFVAEYGCGPGEVLIGLARAGHTVIGIDRSEQMVARANLRASEERPDVAQRISVLHSTIEELAIQESVDAVLMTNELVLHILDAKDLVRGFTLAWGHITLGGRIVLDLPNIDFELLANASGKMQDMEFCRGYFPLADGTTLRVSERTIFSTETWRKEMTFKYERIDASGRMLDSFFRHLEQRMWTAQEICFALELAGAGEMEVRRLGAFPDRVFISAEQRAMA